MTDNKSTGQTVTLVTLNKKPMSSIKNPPKDPKERIMTSNDLNIEFLNKLPNSKTAKLLTNVRQIRPAKKLY